MVLSKDIEHIFARLMREDCAHIQVGDFSVAVCIFDEATKVSLSTPVFDEQGYIPPSVRQVIGRETPPVQFEYPTFPSIDEESGVILLHYTGNLQHFDTEDFKILLETFVGQAEVWKRFLEDKGEPDLVYVPTS